MVVQLLWHVGIGSHGVRGGSGSVRGGAGRGIGRLQTLLQMLASFYPDMPTFAFDLPTKMKRRSYETATIHNHFYSKSRIPLCKQTSIQTV